MNRTIYVCSRCGRRAVDGADAADWLISRRRDGKGMVIRCPDCVTGYAVRMTERYTDFHLFIAKSRKGSGK